MESTATHRCACAGAGGGAMVRRSTVDRSPQSAVHGAGYEAEAEHLETGVAARGHPSRGWGGAGGRWLVWTFRAVLWAVLLIIVYRGVTAIVTGETQRSAATGAGVSTSPASRFPVTLANAYALQFGEVYLNFSPNTAGQRAAQLAGFLPTGAGLVVSGEPAWLPAPSRIPVPSPTAVGTDSATQTVLTNQLPSFFEAYASGNQVTLGRFLAPGAAVSGLGGAVAFKSITNISVPTGGAIRHIIATVLWNLPPQGGATKKGGGAPGGLEMSYALTMMQRGGTWYVRDISAATPSPGPP